VIFVGRLKNYVKESVGELKKVSWPKKDEIVGSTWVVIVFMILMALILGLIDFGAVTAVRMVIK
jgi:preprotein translocase subunit SecE